MGARGHGTVHWTELNTWDVEKAKAFYATVCGWSYDAMPMATGGVYHVAKAGETMVCGLFPLTSPEMDGVPDSWLTYFEVENVDEAAEQVTTAGGTVMRPPWDVPGVGRIAIVRDSTGAVSGMMTPSDT